MLNYGKDPNYSDSYDEAVVRIRISEQAEYEKYIEVYSAIKHGFTLIREEESLKRYGKTYDELSALDTKFIRRQYPLKLVEQTVIE